MDSSGLVDCLALNRSSTRSYLHGLPTFLLLHAWQSSYARGPCHPVKDGVNPSAFVFTRISDFCTILNMNMCSIITNKGCPLQTILSCIFCRFKTANLTILSHKKHMVLTAGISAHFTVKFTPSIAMHSIASRGEFCCVMKRTRVLFYFCANAFWKNEK